MPATYVRIARHSALSTAVVAVIMAAVGLGISGTKGMLGAALGVALVAIFFAISFFVVGRAARISPQAMMIAAMLTYVVKVLVLLVFVVHYSNTTVFSTRLFGLSALACILAWCAAQVYWSMKLKFLYVEPRGEG
jgi:ATP synthase protein I